MMVDNTLKEYSTLIVSESKGGYEWPEWLGPEPEGMDCLQKVMREIVTDPMTNKNSGLFTDIVNEMSERGIEKTLRRLKVAYMNVYYELSEKMVEADNEDNKELIELLAVGDTFLQILADKAGEMGGDPSIIHSIIGKRPKGAGVLTTVGNIMQGCQAGSNDEKEQEGELVCNQGKDLLSELLNLERVKLIFEGIITKGWMTPNGHGGYKWIGFGEKRGRMQQWAYTMGETFGYKYGKTGHNDGDVIPCRELERLFEISGLYSRLIKCWQSKPQKWRKPIDEMIRTVTKSTLN